MRHNRQTHRLGRTNTERKALLENLVLSLVKHQAIKTTLQKAKAAQRLAERVITLGKTDTLAARRQVFSYLQDHQVTSKLFKEVAPRFKNRAGGYTRILRLDRRKGDGAALALLELTEKEVIVKAAKPKRGKVQEEKSETHDHHERHKGHGDVPKHEHKADKPKPGKGGFFKDLGKFFKNKGGG
ncbi:MAG: 50S ribosomal protein L17 [Candidatus Omnitrophica bacterium]|nr:50S ribosomal protein L17 [Candidatus Omnitrophota bacterium]